MVMAEIKTKKAEKESTKTEDEKIQEIKKAVNAIVIKNDAKSSSKKISSFNPVRKTILKKTIKIQSKYSINQIRRQPPTYFDASSLSLTIKRLNSSK
ncbi:Oidioi.mRNA.OKI2018_I69.chr1.g1189.t1.cds [Oikopleura dioica]|uniref:Oidioi.mRNA.OKI2018_I69.chr1.g1189.t1.cds n=1 Tax=Oikopleura dioica TaxID=34765 RepID=A0ABN7STI0_OIKDI|nr:Oidioi.mRNA.OKI2018_I69.chr1.g1189.t1.cds [Oikopleura dioica]